MKRGALQFEVVTDGSLVNSSSNVETLRLLWLDRTLVQGYYLGPGDKGDFDYGAWHVACHLVSAGGVMLTNDKKMLWLEASHDPVDDDYYASVTVKTKAGIRTWALNSAEGRELVSEAKVLGSVEDNSTGRTSSRGVNDPPGMFNLWRRQDFDQPVNSTDDGGKVWEHWCTLRDIRSTVADRHVSAHGLRIVVFCAGRPFRSCGGTGPPGLRPPRSTCSLGNGGLPLRGM